MQIGDSLEAHFTVRPSDSAEALELTPEDSYPNVFATSRLVAFMEMAATRLMKPLLEPGQHSVGVEVSIKHTAPTPVGGHVRTIATYLRPEGRADRRRRAHARDRLDEPAFSRCGQARPLAKRGQIYFLLNRWTDSFFGKIDLSPLRSLFARGRRFRRAISSS